MRPWNRSLHYDDVVGSGVYGLVTAATIVAGSAYRRAQTGRREFHGSAAFTLWAFATSLPPNRVWRDIL